MLHSLPDGNWLPVEEAYTALGLKSVDALRGRIKRRDPRIITRKVSNRVLVLVPNDPTDVIDVEAGELPSLPVPLNAENIVPELRDLFLRLLTDNRDATTRAARFEAELTVALQELAETKRKLGQAERKMAQAILRLDDLERRGRADA